MVLLLLLLLLPLRLVTHPVGSTRLIQQRLPLLFAVGSLLVLLHEIAGSATARAEAVLAAVAGQVVFSADVTAIHQGQDPAKTNAEETGKGSALQWVSLILEGSQGVVGTVRWCYSMSTNSCHRCSSCGGGCGRAGCMGTTTRGSLDG